MSPRPRATAVLAWPLLFWKFLPTLLSGPARRQERGAISFRTTDFYSIGREGNSAGSGVNLSEQECTACCPEPCPLPTLRQ